MFASLSLTALLVIFAAAGGVILICGLRMTGLADQLADRTGLGEALLGGVLLGAATSLSGTVVSVTTALEGNSSMAFSNGIGGIAAQTAFLAVADITHRGANLEHAAADVGELFQAGLLMLLLTVPFAAYAGPELSFLGVHPASVLMLVIYVGGVWASRRVRETPMWMPVSTSQTRRDEPDEPTSKDRTTASLFSWFTILMLIMGVAGWVIAQVASELTGLLNLSASFVGALMTAVVTSLPELVTTLAAVHRGALQLAVGGIIGGNTFDTLFLMLSDFGYRDGSIYHALQPMDILWLAVGLMMTAVLLMGLVYRQRSGPGGIGLESVLMLVIYAGAVAVQGFVG